MKTYHYLLIAFIFIITLLMIQVNTTDDSQTQSSQEETEVLPDSTLERLEIELSILKQVPALNSQMVRLIEFTISANQRRINKIEAVLPYANSTERVQLNEEMSALRKTNREYVAKIDSYAVKMNINQQRIEEIEKILKTHGVIQ